MQVHRCTNWKAWMQIINEIEEETTLNQLLEKSQPYNLEEKGLIRFT